MILNVLLVCILLGLICFFIGVALAIAVFYEKRYVKSSTILLTVFFICLAVSIWLYKTEIAPVLDLIAE